MYYYAVLNENKFVVELVTSETDISDSTHISITEEQYTNGNLLWLYYKNGQFIVCDNFIGSSDWIIYKNTDTPLTPRLIEYEENIAALQSGKADIYHLHSLGDIAETDSQKIMTAAERTKLSGIAENANNYVHPTSHSASMITGLSSVATSGSYEDLANKPSIPTAYTHPATHPASMITGLPTTLPANGGNADTVDGKHSVDFATATHNHDSNYAAISHNHNSAYSGINHNHDTDYADISHIHSYADLTNKPSTFTPATHTHAQSEITGLETALSGKASTGHTHSVASTTAAGFMSKDDKAKLDGISANANNYTHPSNHPISMITGLLDLLLTKENGDVKESLSGKDVVSKFTSAPIGVMTYYAPINTTNSPKLTESWRFISHKTGVGFGWILGFSNQGSVYSGYVDSGNWKGWKAIYDATPAPLWTGASYLNHQDGANPQTVTPSKKLSECAHGWILLWSDYDPGQGTGTNSDFCTSVVTNRAYTGQKWAGGAWYFDIPRYMGGNLADSSTERRIIKAVKVYDDKLVGMPGNTQGDRNDVVLRAIYEF